MILIIILLILILIIHFSVKVVVIFFSKGGGYKDIFLYYMDYKKLKNTSLIEQNWLDYRNILFKTENTQILESTDNIKEEFKLFDLLLQKSSSAIKIIDGKLIIDLNDAKLVADSIISIIKNMPLENLIVVGSIIPAF